MAGPDGVVVRRYKAADLEALILVYLSLAEHHAALAPDRYRVPDPLDVRTRFANLHRDPENLHLVAELDGVVVGQLDAWLEDVASPGSTRRPKASAHVGLAVLPAARGRGIGTAMLREAEAWAAAHGLEQLTLEVADENGDARRLYERMGYGPLTHSMVKPLR